MKYNIKLGDKLTIVENNATCTVLDIDEKSDIIAVDIVLPDGTDLGVVKYKLSGFNEAYNKSIK